MVASKNRSKLSFGSLLLRFCITFGSTIGSVSLVIGIGEWIFGWKILASTGILGAALFVVLCTFVSTLSVLFAVVTELKQSLENEEDEKGNLLTDTLMTELEKAYNEKRWEEVLKIGSVLSRPLWITGKYRLRVRLGKIVEAAAAFSDKPYIQASALIDDLGWTKYVLGDVDESKKNILHGIQIANKSEHPFLSYKGYRHLSGIAMDSGHLIEADAHLEKAREYAIKLAEGVGKQEALAGLYLNKALIEIKKSNWQQALTDLDASELIYQAIGDEERKVKLYHYKGDVLLEMGRLAEAKDVYREGLIASRQESRKDGILQNTLGIAKIAFKEGDLDVVKRAYSECALLAQELGREVLAKELVEKLASLRRRSRRTY